MLSHNGNRYIINKQEEIYFVFTVRNVSISINECNRISLILFNIYYTQDHYNHSVIRH